jgi:hypothetical protein
MQADKNIGWRFDAGSLLNGPHFVEPQIVIDHRNTQRSREQRRNHKNGSGC